jgi:hypothetical protein
MTGLMDRWYAPKLRYIAFVAEEECPELDLFLDEAASRRPSESEDEGEGGKANANANNTEGEGEHRDDPDSGQPTEQLQKSEDSHSKSPLKITGGHLERLVAFFESRSEAFARVEQVRFVGIELPDMTPSAMIEERSSAVERLMSAVRHVEVVSD